MMQCHGGIPYAQEHGFALQSVDALYNTLLLTAMLTRCPRLQQFPEGPCVHRPQGYKFRLTQFADLRLQYPAFIYVCVVHGLVGNGEGSGGPGGGEGGRLVFLQDSSQFGAAICSLLLAKAKSKCWQTALQHQI